VQAKKADIAAGDKCCICQCDFAHDPTGLDCLIYALTVLYVPRLSYMCLDCLICALTVLRLQAKEADIAADDACCICQCDFAHDPHESYT